MKIYKYPIELTEKQTIQLPVGYQILDIQIQQGRPRLWALIEEGMGAKDNVIIECFGTGQEIDMNQRKYISTIQYHGSSLVYHFFARVNKAISDREFEDSRLPDERK